MAIESPRASSSAPRLAAERPLPRDDTTPPVTKMNFVFFGFARIRGSRGEGQWWGSRPSPPSLCGGGQGWGGKGGGQSMQHPLVGGKHLAHPRQVLGGVDSHRNIRGGDDAHLEAMFERPELLELLGPLQPSLGELRKL